MTIHSLCPRKKLVLYWVTYELPHVLRTAISCWISWMSSSLDSRSICAEQRVSFALVPLSRADTYMLDRDSLACCLLDGFVNDAKAAACSRLSVDVLSM